MRRVLIVLLPLLFVLGCEQSEYQDPMARAQEKLAKKSVYVAVLHTNMGDIQIGFFEKDAPENVKNVVGLIKKGFYDGTKFHRVIPGFVIQGGDPLSKDNNPFNDGTGGPGYLLRDEISQRLHHLRGTVSMANAGPNTNGSQFFICLTDLRRLDGSYTIIGQVIKGMAVVDSIAKLPTDSTDHPMIPVVIEKVEMIKG